MKKRIAFIIPVTLFVVVIVLFNTVLFIGYVPTASMSPTLKEGSLIIGLRQYDSLKVGDVIVFKHDGGVLVKRIAATGGQTITIDECSYTVPEDNFFVMGDNRENSFDSRYWENPYVNKSKVIAKL